MTDVDKIIQGLRQALELTPDNVPLKKHLADMLFQNERFENAEKDTVNWSPSILPMWTSNSASPSHFIAKRSGSWRWWCWKS